MSFRKMSLTSKLNINLGEGKRVATSTSQCKSRIVKVVKRKPRNSFIIEPEEVEQQEFVKWLDDNCIIFYHIRNEGTFSKRLINGKMLCLEGIKFKRLGVKSGVPDICVPIARGGFHGLYIELKRLDGGSGLSETQKVWINALSREGYKAVQANGHEAAIEVVKNYLLLSKGA